MMATTIAIVTFILSHVGISRERNFRLFEKKYLKLNKLNLAQFQIIKYSTILVHIFVYSFINFFQGLDAC